MLAYVATTGSDFLTSAVPPRPWSVFLDRDGVLNRKAPPDDYIRTWAAFAWLPGSREAIARLHRAGARVVIVTNQQGVAKGLIRGADLEDIHARLRADVERAGGRIAGIYVCPHLAGACDCRKPLPGLFHQASRDMPEIAFERSVVVGDSASDVEAGRRIGARTIRIAGTNPDVRDDGSARDLADAVDRIVLPWIKT